MCPTTLRFKTLSDARTLKMIMKLKSLTVCMHQVRLFALASIPCGSLPLDPFGVASKVLSDEQLPDVQLIPVSEIQCISVLCCGNLMNYEPN